MPTLPVMVAPQVVVMTTFGTTNDDNVGIMTTLNFQDMFENILMCQSK